MGTMRKLALTLDDLHVETFATGDDAPRRGTVEAHYGGPGPQTHYTCDTCGREWTLEGSCDPTCGPPDTCGHDWCGTYPMHGCPNSMWYCTDCKWVC